MATNFSRSPGSHARLHASREHVPLVVADVF